MVIGVHFPEFIWQELEKSLCSVVLHNEVSVFLQLYLSLCF